MYNQSGTIFIFELFKCFTGVKYEYYNKYMFFKQEERVPLILASSAMDNKFVIFGRYK